MARNLATVQSDSATLETQPKTLTKTKKTAEITSGQTSQALAIEELIIAFDDDLRMAILEQLVRHKQTITEQADRERQASKILELARYAAVERAKTEGKQQARAEIVTQKQKLKAEAQKQFIEVELSKILDACDYLSYEAMKQTAEGFAKLVGVKLEWKDLENGQFQCTPSII